MGYTMRLILTGDGSLVLIKYYNDGTPRKTALLPAGTFEIAQLTGCLSTLSGKQVSDLVLGSNKLSLDSHLEQMVEDKLKIEDDDGYSPSMLNKQ